MPDVLSVNKIIDQAVSIAELDDFGGDSWREGLEVLVADINADEQRPEANAQFNGQTYATTLANRLKVVNAIKQRPEVLEAPIERPVFVFGIPRTGTTLLSNLLAADPARRSPLKWELDDPVPPPTTETLYTDPRAIAALEMERMIQQAMPDTAKYYRMSATYPYEDVTILAHDFKTLMLESAGRLPNYRDWILSTDTHSAYDYHKRFLQLHQADAPGIWNLKMPSHALQLETLLDVYPDARLIWTHRDPFTATGSFCSLIEFGQQFQAGYVDLQWIGENMPWQAAQHAERAMDARARIGDDRIIDVHYADLMRDPMATMREVYGRLNDPFTAEAEAAMTAWLADNPQGKFGRHEYRLGKFGLSQEKLQPMFERYLAAYDIEREG